MNQEDSGKSEETDRRRRSWSDLGPRFASAVVLIPVTLVALVLGGVWFALFVGLLFAGVYREWETMISGRPPGLVAYSLAAMVALSAAVHPFAGAPGSAGMCGIAVVFGLVFGGSQRLWRTIGLVFFCAVIVAMLAVRGSDLLGVWAGVFLAASVWGTDSAAFFTGRQVGGAKLSPDISPSKTWSGAAGGLAIGSFVGLAVWVITTNSPWWIGLVLAALLSVVGQAGDLAESAIKRHFKVKDSGDIIPGHGGLMDRLDSLTFATLAVFVIGVSRAGDGSIAAGFLIW